MHVIQGLRQLFQTGTAIPAWARAPCAKRGKCLSLSFFRNRSPWDLCESVLEVLLMSHVYRGRLGPMAVDLTNLPKIVYSPTLLMVGAVT